MEANVEVCGTREQLIKSLTDATNRLQSEDTYSLTIPGEGDAPDLKLNFSSQSVEDSGDRETPWIRNFQETH